MSGYNPQTGWTHFTPTKASRFWRRVDGQPDNLDARLDATGLDWYYDATGGIHVRCDDGRLWNILSGMPATRTSASPDDPADQTEWVSVTDIGAAVAVPALGTSTVLRLLRDEGLLHRVDGKDQPTEAASGLFDERPVGDNNHAARFPRKPGAVQRRWAYPVLARLRDRAIRED